MRVLFLYVLIEVSPAVARHLDVCHEQGEPLLVQEVQGLPAVPRRGHAEALPREDVLQCFPYRLLVVDDEEPLARGHALFFGRRRAGLVLPERPRNYRELDCDHGAALVRARHLYGAAVLGHYAVRYGEAQASALADPLGREERVEYLVYYLSRYSGTVVLEGDPYPAGFAAGGDPEAPLALLRHHRVFGVVYYVDEDLLHLEEIDHRPWQFILQIERDLYVVRLERVLSELYRVPDDVVYAVVFPLGLLGPREGEEVLDYLGRPEGLVVYLTELVLDVVELLVPRRVHQYLAEAHYAHERVVELVRNARDKLSEARELLGMEGVLTGE